MAPVEKHELISEAQIVSFKPGITAQQLLSLSNNNSCKYKHLVMWKRGAYDHASHFLPVNNNYYYYSLKAPFHVPEQRLVAFRFTPEFTLNLEFWQSGTNFVLS